MERPRTVTILGVLNVLFGLYGLVRGAFTLHAIFGMGGAELGNMFDQPLLTLGVLLGMVISVALIAAGVGLLRLRSWARQFSILYGVWILLATVLFYISQYVAMSLGAGTVRSIVEGVCSDGLFGVLAGAGAGSIQVDVKPGPVNAVVAARTTDFVGLVYAIILAIGMFRVAVMRVLVAPPAHGAALPAEPSAPAE